MSPFRAVYMFLLLLMQVRASLAEAELLVTFAHVFRKFDMELVTKSLTPRDVFATVLAEGGIKVLFKQKSL